MFENSVSHQKIPKAFSKKDSFSKKELEEKFGVPVYVRWNLVPLHFHPRNWFKQKGITVPLAAPPDAIKGGGGFTCSYSFLFDEKRYL